MDLFHDIIRADSVVFLIASPLILHFKMDLEWLYAILIAIAAFFVLRLIRLFKIGYYVVSVVFSLFWAFMFSTLVYIFEPPKWVSYLSLGVFFIFAMGNHIHNAPQKTKNIYVLGIVEDD